MTDTIHSSTTENIIDDGKFKITLPSEIYNVFVNPSKIRSTIDLGGFVAQDIEITNINSAGTTTEKYNLVLGQDICYGCSIVRNLTCTVKATGVQYGENKQIKAYLDGILHANTQTMTPESLDDCSGLPHPFFPGAAGFICDPLNSSLSTVNLALGSTLLPVTQANMTPALVNSVRKLCTDATLWDPRWNGLLFPETFKPEIYEQDSKKLRVVPFKGAVQQWYHLKDDATVPVAVGDKAYPTLCERDSITHTKAFINENVMTLDEVNDMDFNQFSVKKRGAIYKTAKFTFKKAKPSYNWEFSILVKDNTRYGMLKPQTTTTTDLYEMVIGENMYRFPTHVKNWKDALDFGVHPWALIWYYNTQSRALTVSSLNQIAYVIDATYNEPADQSLEATMEFQLSAPVLNPLLSDEITKCFSGVSTGYLELLQNGNLKNLFRIIANPGNGLTSGDRGDPAFNPLTPLSNIGGIDVSFSNQKILLRSYKLAELAPYIKKQIMLPFMQSSIVMNNLETVCNGPDNEKSLKKFQSTTVHSQLINIGASVPRYLMIYCDFPLTYRIKNFKVMYQGVGNSQLLTMASLMNATRRNGMDFKKFDEEGYPIIANSACNAFRIPTRKSFERAAPVGTFLMLKFGSDIDLPYGFYPGMTGLSLALQYEFELEFADIDIIPGTPGYNIGDKFTGTLIINHISEQDYVISENKTELRSQLITNVESVAAVSKLVKRIEGDMFHLSRNRVYTGGNFISSMFRNVRNFAPKILHGVHNGVSALKKGAEFVNNHADTIQKGTGALAKWLT